MSAGLELPLQQVIEALYRIEGSPRVTDYAIDAEVLSACLGPEAPDRTHREALVVQHEGGETLLALFIAEDVRLRAQQFLDAHPHPRRDSNHPHEDDHLDEFCVVAEGVSHFVYFTYCGNAHDRPVSQIELELQAEIDKYLVLRVAFGWKGAALVSRLFDEFRLADTLTHGEIERYRVANGAARRYARWAEDQFSRGHGARALADARDLYRKPLTEKLDHISRAA